jgi:hypothetical protein
LIEYALSASILGQGLNASSSKETFFPLGTEVGLKNVGLRIMERKLTIVDIILIAGTRIALGAGIGLLLSSRLNNDQRKAAGLALALVGGLTTIPLALGVIGKKSAEEIKQAA